LETIVQSRDERMTRCQHEGFLTAIISQILLEVLRRLFIALIAYSCSGPPMRFHIREDHCHKSTLPVAAGIHRYNFLLPFHFIKHTTHFSIHISTVVTLHIYFTSLKLYHCPFHVKFSHVKQFSSHFTSIECNLHSIPLLSSATRITFLLSPSQREKYIRTGTSIIFT